MVSWCFTTYFFDCYLFHSKMSIIIMIIIIIITLLHEDNTFGTGSSLTDGPPLTDVIKEMKRHIIIYSMYRVDALRKLSRLRAGYPILLQWRGRYDFSRLKTSP